MDRPSPLFDNIERISRCHEYVRFCANANQDDYQQSLAFLKSYTGSQGTFNSYRREIERLLHWTWLVANKTVSQLQRDDIEAFIRFCQRPPTEWIGEKVVPRFIAKDDSFTSNPEWRPFVVTISKAARKRGQLPKKSDFNLSQGAIQEIFAILSTYFNFLIIEHYIQMNPVALIRQKSKFIQKQQGKQQIRRLNERQWRYLINAAKHMAEQKPQQHERTLFIISTLYSLYLRISELAASQRWSPTMNDFHEDSEGNWWFNTVGKGNKARQIAVSDTMLNALIRWREFLNLSSLPSPADNSPLIPKLRGHGPMTDVKTIRDLVQRCFDAASEQLIRDEFQIDGENLAEATVHWLRHTGISDDVKHRPREHVRDDAGHSSGATTDRYIDVDLQERHRSAKNKVLDRDEKQNNKTY